MATGAKIGIVLGLLLVVIAFVRILDRDISDEVGKLEGNESATESAGGDHGFAPLGSDEAVESASETPVAERVEVAEEDKSTISDAEENGEIKPAGLRSVRSEDRGTGLIGSIDPVDPDPVREEYGPSEELVSGLFTEGADHDPIPAIEDGSGAGGTEFAQADPTDPWPIGGDTGNGITSPEELFRLMQGEDSEPDRPNPGLRPQPEEPTTDASAAEVAATTVTADDRGTSIEPSSASSSREDRGTVTPVIAAGYPKTHTVVENDTLWDLAGHYYGKPILFKEIIKANSGMTESSPLKVGSKITIPSPRTAVGVAGRPRPASTGVVSGESSISADPTTHRVVKGDSLYRIAARILGRGERWTEIAEANPSVDPDHLVIGIVLKIPPK